jgi:hypothetical protein
MVCPPLKPQQLQIAPAQIEQIPERIEYQLALHICFAEVEVWPHGQLPWHACLGKPHGYFWRIGGLAECVA